MARDRPALSISLASCPLLIFTLRTSRTNLRMVVKDVCMADFMFAFFTMSLEGDLLEVEEFFERDATFLFNFPISSFSWTISSSFRLSLIRPEFILSSRLDNIRRSEVESTCGISPQYGNGYGG